MPVVSKYTQVWNKLKISRKCEIVALPSLHKRIVKAVCKKKDRDLAHKLMTSEKGYSDKIRIEYKLEENKIIFYLDKVGITIDDL